MLIAIFSIVFLLFFGFGGDDFEYKMTNLKAEFIFISEMIPGSRQKDTSDFVIIFFRRFVFP